MLWQNEDQAAADALRRSGNDLPTTFGDTFSAAWSRNDFFMQNTLGEKDRLDALGDYLDTIKQKTGEDLAPTLDYGGAAGFMTPAWPACSIKRTRSSASSSRKTRNSISIH